MWDMYGLEAIINITEQEQESIVSVLKGEIPRQTNPIQYMILRARFNQQRHYEIYSVVSDLSEEDFKTLFETDPQTIVNSIRENGVELYSDRVSKKTVVIT
jgi:hypothetical protein